MAEFIRVRAGYRSLTIARRSCRSSPWNLIVGHIPIVCRGIASPEKVVIVLGDACIVDACNRRTREPMDKSGSYGIQGVGGQFVRKVEG